MKMDSSSGGKLWNKEGLRIRELSSQPHLEDAKGIIRIGGVLRISRKGESNQEWAPKFCNSSRHAPQTCFSRPSNIIGSPKPVYRIPFSGTIYAYFFRLFFDFCDFNGVSIHSKNEIHEDILFNNYEGISSQGRGGRPPPHPPKQKNKKGQILICLRRGYVQTILLFEAFNRLCYEVFAELKRHKKITLI